MKLCPAPYRFVVPANARIGQYTNTILINISTGSLFTFKYINLPDLTY